VLAGCNGAPRQRSATPNDDIFAARPAPYGD